MELSIVVPLFNEEDNIKFLIEELACVLKELKSESEVILIDDGSEDRSPQIIKDEIKGKPNFKLICLNRNFGQTAALACGFNEAGGKIVVTMDADTQNDPHDIPALLGKMGEGVDVVSGWRKKRKAPYLSRRLPSYLANLLISRITGVKLHDYGCSLTVKFILSYSTRPIQIFGAWGLILTLWGVASLAALISMRVFMGIDMTGNPFLLLSVFLWIIGMQFIVLGLLAEIVTRTYHESQKKPIYIIREIYSANTGD
jgi:glycosyltransferase involved in cell wall biosynthesis